MRCVGLCTILSRHSQYTAGKKRFSFAIVFCGYLVTQQLLDTWGQNPLYNNYYENWKEKQFARINFNRNSLLIHIWTKNCAFVRVVRISKLRSYIWYYPINLFGQRRTHAFWGDQFLGVRFKDLLNAAINKGFLAPIVPKLRAKEKVLIFEEKP